MVIIALANSRDANESDTVIIVTDMLSEVFGYDKYSEITSEHTICSTYCDLAIKVEGRLALLLEVKAIGLSLKDNYIKQAVDYAANQGCDWVLLTNGVLWQSYRVPKAATTPKTKNPRSPSNSHPPRWCGPCSQPCPSASSSRAR